MSINVRMEITGSSVVNYAIQQNKKPIVSRVRIYNEGMEELRNVKLVISSLPEDLCLPYQQHIDLIPGGTALEITPVELLLNSTYLAGLSEKLTTALQFSIVKDDEELYVQPEEITVLPANYWMGTTCYPELLAAYVTPNHGLVPAIKKDAQAVLEKWTGSPDFVGYLSGDTNRVYKTAGAIFEAIKAQNIAYAVAPASFETRGQRIRLIHEILEEKYGNCIEMTCLYAACLEDAGLNPFIILVPGHAFLGCWLENKSFGDVIIDDKSLIESRLDEGNRQLIVVECTLMNAGKNCSFEEAQHSARRTLAKGMESCLDITVARRMGVTPLPIHEDESHTFSVQDIPSSDTDKTVNPSDLDDVTPEAGVKTVYTKPEEWELRLLNFDMRNTLLNFSFSRNTTLPVFCDDMTALADALAMGKEMALLPAGDNEDEAYADFEQMASYMKDDSADLSEKRMRSPLKAKEMEKRAKSLKKLAATSLEEKGANTLYLTMGMLRWYEDSSRKKERYAPILMYPVDIVNTSAGYAIRLREEEPMLNITLMEKLKQEYQVELPRWETLPQRDNGGVDIRTILASLRPAIEDRGWTVMKGVNISNFAFTNFVLWRDIHYHPEVLPQNQIVQSLCTGRMTWDGHLAEFLQCIPEENRPMPLGTDASQLFAIEAACKGWSFVLQGPPGTGKSQTITSLIATALREGKKVLFVTEKLAGLTVVQKRLEQLGLAPFCLELHSANSKKSDVLQHYKHTLDLDKGSDAKEFFAKSRKYAQTKETLDAYSDALHRATESGLSLYDLIVRYEQIEGGDDFVFSSDDVPDPSMITEELLEKHNDLLAELTTMRHAVGDPSRSAFRQIRSANYSQKMKQDFVAAVAGYRKALEKVQCAADTFAQVHDLPQADTYADLKSFGELVEQMEAWKEFPSAWGKASALEQTLQPIEEMAQCFRKAEDQRCELLNTWKESFLNEDAQVLIEQYNKAVAASPLVAKFRMAALRSRLEKHCTAKSRIPDEAISGQLTKLRHYQNTLARAQELKKQYRAELVSHFGEEPEESYDWATIEQSADAAKCSAVKIRELAQCTDETFRTSHIGHETGRQESEEMLKAWQTVVDKREKLFNELLHTEPATHGTNWIQSELENCRAVMEQIDGLKDWISWNRLCDKAEKAGMKCVVEAYRTGEKPQDVTDSYRKAVYQTMIAHIIDTDPMLSEFNGMLFNDQIESLRRLDQEVQELTRLEIYQTVADRVRGAVEKATNETTDVTTLNKAILSKGRGISLRKLYSEIPELLLELCPCMLMSPVSVAQYLPMQNELFDLVVFDEASQLQTCKAVGALARGKSAVIVGDYNQMPPTSFFASSNTSDVPIVCYADDNSKKTQLTEDLESILDDCMALNMPMTSLKWHYRSQHESLIAFSNDRFYDGRLLTFPSARDIHSHVTTRFVENGVFDRGKTRRNQAEAEAVIEYLKELSRDETRRGMSVGIVTFNIEQQELIEDLFCEACRNDETLRQWNEQAKEKMFIKNLENVQGDERDIILLSINYGPDQEGKVSMNFGPLNRDGGWRRLNVAVSRSRHEMVVFTSMLPEQIESARVGSRGVAELRAFLEYAAADDVQKRPANRSTLKMMASPKGVAESLCRRLKECGYDTVRHVGCSDLRVDVAVVHPHNPDQYIMGILLDGEAYSAAKSTRDRELSQVEALGRLGWNIHRVWTLDWWEDRKKVMNTLLAELQTLCEKAG